MGWDGVERRDPKTDLVQQLHALNTGYALMVQELGQMKLAAQEMHQQNKAVIAIHNEALFDKDNGLVIRIKNVEGVMLSLKRLGWAIIVAGFIPIAPSMVKWLAGLIVHP